MDITQAFIDTLVACELAAALPTLCANKEWRAAHRLKILDVERIKQARERIKEAVNA